jgi:tetratricopeptide (TPR) repeat protein
LQLNRATALEALKRYGEARDCYTRLLETMPGQTYFLFCRARLSSLAGDHLLVIEDANQLLEADPNQSFALTMRAYALTQLQRFHEALADAERAVALQPDSTYAIWLWASLVAKTGRSNSSTKLLRQRIEANPGDSVAWLQLALLYSQQRLLTKALDAYSVVIELGQHRAFAYQQRADIYLKAAMRKEAIDDYDESLKFDPNNSGALNNLAWVLSTAPEAELRDGKRALELALKACDVTSYQQAHILSTLAAAYAECGNFASARKWSQQSVELADDSIKESCRRELASYEKEQPWREDMGATEE